MKRGIKIIGTALLVFEQSLNICPKCCCGINIKDLIIDGYTKMSKDDIKKRINDLKKAFKNFKEDDIDKSFRAYGKYLNDTISVIDSSLYKRITSEYKSKFKKFGDTELYFTIGGKNGDYVNKVKVEQSKDKKNTFTITLPTEA